MVWWGWGRQTPAPTESASSNNNKRPRERVLVVGGTGRTGRRLVRRLTDDPRVDVVVVARDPVKASSLFPRERGGTGSGAGVGVEVVKGDLLDVGGWKDALEGCTCVVTGVGAGARGAGGLLDLLGLGSLVTPSNSPEAVDYKGIGCVCVCE